MGTEPALPLLSVYPLHPAEQTPHTFLLSCGHDLPRQLWGVPSRCTQQVITHLPTSKTGVSVKSQVPCVAFVPDPESGPRPSPGTEDFIPYFLLLECLAPRITAQSWWDSQLLSKDFHHKSIQAISPKDTRCKEDIRKHHGLLTVYSRCTDRQN